MRAWAQSDMGHEAHVGHDMGAWATMSTKDARQSTEGYAHDGRLFSRGARDQELDGNRDTRHKIYTCSGRQCDVKPYVMCSVGLY